MCVRGDCPGIASPIISLGAKIAAMPPFCLSNALGNETRHTKRVCKKAAKPINNSNSAEREANWKNTHTPTATICRGREQCGVENLKHQ